MTQKITATPQRIIGKALSQVGVHEGHTAAGWNNNQRYSDETPGLEWSDGQPWCATFVSWCAFKSGLATIYPRTASCDVAAAWFKHQGRWSEFPGVGAQVFYGSTADLNHTGLVIDFDSTFIYTVEGNTNDDGSREGDGVYRKVRRRRDTNVVGYGYPKFPEGIVSGDPDFAGESAPEPTQPPAHVPKTPHADKAYEEAQKGQSATKDPARKAIWAKVVKKLKGLSSRY